VRWCPDGYFLATFLEVVDKFCYLGDMLSVDGDADTAVEASCVFSKPRAAGFRPAF